jgi:membrane glycosyltransferase
MLKNLAWQQDAAKTLLMPDQNLRAPFRDDMAPGLEDRKIPKLRRLVLLGLPLAFLMAVGGLLLLIFRGDGQLTFPETVLVVLMALLSGWSAVPTANAFIGLLDDPRQESKTSVSPLTVAILVTIRDEPAQNVIPGKLALLRALQGASEHTFSLHVLSDSTSIANVEEEQRMVRAAFPHPVFHSRRPSNIDFKSGNIRTWIREYGAAHDAFIILDADSEMDSETALLLADSLSADPACALIQTVPQVLLGGTLWQHMQSVASNHYGRLQGYGLAAWMGDESNFYGHNAIIRTSAFATCTGLPHLEGRGLWNGAILSHDFVEAALLRRAGWAVRLLPVATGSFEKEPADVIAHLKRDERWCHGNFQHSRILGAAGLHPVSRFHLLSGIFTYLSSVVWLLTLLLWAVLDATKAGVGGTLAAATFFLIAINLFLPRILGVIHATAQRPERRFHIAGNALAETVFSSLFAPSLMVQRVMMISRVLAARRMEWPTHEKARRSFLAYFTFHIPELLVGLALLAFVERGLLTFWFLPLGGCLAFTCVLSWLCNKPFKVGSHEELNGTTPL